MSSVIKRVGGQSDHPDFLYAALCGVGGVIGATHIDNLGRGVGVATAHDSAPLGPERFGSPLLQRGVGGAERDSQANAQLGFPYSSTRLSAGGRAV